MTNDLIQSMDMNNISKELAEIIQETFKLDLHEEFLEKCPKLDEDFNEPAIFKNIFFKQWKKSTLERIKSKELLEISNISEHLLECSHNLCCIKARSEFKIIHRLLQYIPSETAKSLKNGNFKELFLSKQNGISATQGHDNFLEKRKLDSNNFCDVQELLLNVEDITTFQEYQPFIQTNVNLLENGKKIYVVPLKNTPANFTDIVMPDLDMVIVLSLEKKLACNITSDMDITEMLVSLQNQRVPTATVRSVSMSQVTIESILDLKPKYRTFDLIFYSQRLPIRYQYCALSTLRGNSEMREFLFPKAEALTYIPKEVEHAELDIQLINKELANNQEQFQAVRTILTGLNPTVPYIIFGPPGTGKTTTLVESILQLRLRNPQSRILVTAGSNSACDTIALRICEYFKNNPLLQAHLFSPDADVLPILRIYSKSVFRRKGDQIPDILLKHSNYKWISGNFACPAVQDIAMYGIVVATLCTVGKLVCGDVAQHSCFTHVFIDEAAASSETETLIGIMGIKFKRNDRCHIILSGDHKQLGPVIKSAIAEEYGLGQSMMKRLLDRECYAMDTNGNYNSSLQARLRRNYRSHPGIVGLYNTLYYNNELIPMNLPENDENKREWSFLPNSKFPIAFQAVHGVTARDEVKSSSNVLEINVLTWYVKRLLEVDGAKQTDIGVITPYKSQCQCIRNRLSSRRWTDIEVGTVENFQGREKNIIIVSMVRSFSGLGFLKSPQRLNVMLSRPKSLLLIIGNPLTLRQFKDMNFIIEQTKAQGHFLHKKRDHNKEKNYEKVILKTEDNNTENNSNTQNLKDHQN